MKEIAELFPTLEFVEGQVTRLREDNNPAAASQQ